MTVHEVTWRAVKDLVEAEDTDYDTYDDFVRASVESADDHFGVLDEDLSEAVSDGRAALVDVELDDED